MSKRGKKNQEKAEVACASESPNGEVRCLQNVFFVRKDNMGRIHHCEERWRVTEENNATHAMVGRYADKETYVVAVYAFDGC